MINMFSNNAPRTPSHHHIVTRTNIHKLLYNTQFYHVHISK